MVFYGLYQWLVKSFSYSPNIICIATPRVHFSPSVVPPIAQTTGKTN